ncbi:MAG: hypothetical protein LUI06_10020 [Ruminococcus sp.]|nr:hypothetical protein [Ruminococcus sp.]
MIQNNNPNWILEKDKSALRLTSVYVTKKKVTKKMEIRLFDKVLLKDGRKGDVVEVFG